MTLGTSTAESKPKRNLGCLGIVGGVIAVTVLIVVISSIVSSAQKQQWTANSGSRTVTLTGALAGDGWSIANSGQLRTNAQYSETSFLVHVSRVGDASRNTPLFTVSVGDSNGSECTTFRSYIWSTEEGSDMEVLCTNYLTLDELRKVHSVEVTDAG